MTVYKLMLFYNKTAETTQIFMFSLSEYLGINVLFKKKKL